MGKRPARDSRDTPGAGAIIFALCLLVPVFYAACIRFNISPLDLWQKRLSNPEIDLSSGVGDEDLETEGEPLSFLFRRLVRGKSREELDATNVSCVSDDPISDTCLVGVPLALDMRATTLHLRTPLHFHQTLRPYAGKQDPVPMRAVTPFHIVGAAPIPACHVNHRVPALIFSSGGFSTNLFHDLNDILLPVFLTSFHFRSNLRFVIADFKPDWVRKFGPIISHLSKYEPIDPVADGRIHCFPGAVVGMRYHGNLFCNATAVPNGYSPLDFKRFLRTAFSVENRSQRNNDPDPVLLLISRRGSRVFKNEEEMVRVARDVGYRVTVASPQRVANLKRFAGVVHGCDVMVGAHGAGMTNLLFLQGGAVLVQVVPLGLDWASEAYYGGPARQTDVHYLEYKVKAEESTLSDLYPLDHPVIVDPDSVHRLGYNVSRAVYLDGQNLRLDLSRFRETLVRAKNLVRSNTD